MFSKISYFCIIVVICWSDKVNAVPPDYCLENLNTSDCKGAPIPVFYYYKPGSRCELGIWRGCPTANKFDDQYLCSHNCVFNFIKPKATTADDNDIDTKDQCSKTITENKCKDNKQNIAYTFNDGTKDCVPIIWGDCKSPNIFREKQTCVDTCATDWQDDVNTLKDDEFKEIDQLLDDYLAPETESTNKRLKLAEETTPPSTTPMTPSDVTTDGQTTTEAPATPTVTVEDTTETTIRTRGPKGPARSVELP